MHHAQSLPLQYVYVLNTYTMLFYKVPLFCNKSHRMDGTVIRAVIPWLCIGLLYSQQFSALRYIVLSEDASIGP